ncbi:hypothetical protein M0805_009783 [Coniferiporia weirii]|nr:hypothetical protein M0805_009783 [Coniferiporia weirii]
MSRRVQPTIEDAFDDDTDIPLPSRPLPNTGTKGALLQSLDDDDDDEVESESDGNDDQRLGRPSSSPGPASPSHIPSGFGTPQPPYGAPTVSDLTPYKKWTCIYPIYIDAKRAYGPGTRRVAREKAVWWPLSKDIADATTRLGLGTLHEVQKCHPRDWENPGRVRVQLRRDGRLVNERIKTKKQLLEAIAFYIQNVKPELIPKPPFESSPLAASSVSTSGKQPPAGAKAKQATTKSVANVTAGTKGKGKGKGQGQDTTAPHPARSRLPQPPEPQPPLASRVSAYSPVLSTGVLVDTIKAGMSAAAAEGATAPPGMGGKGKRKVVRVRG